LSRDPFDRFIRFPHIPTVILFVRASGCGRAGVKVNRIGLSNCRILAGTWLGCWTWGSEPSLQVEGSGVSLDRAHGGVGGAGEPTQRASPTHGTFSYFYLFLVP